MNIMKRYSILLISLFFFTVISNIQSQEIDWDKLSCGFSISYSFPTEKVEPFGDNTPEIGGELQYQISENIFLSSGMHFSYFKSKAKELMPSFYYISIPLELKILFPLAKKINIFTAGGIQSNTLAFVGESSEVLGDNNIESEFGVFIMMGFRTAFIGFEGLEIYTKYQTVFTSPESTNFINIGGRFFF